MDRLMKDAQVRDTLVREEEVLSLEMEVQERYNPKG